MKLNVSRWDTDDKDGFPMEDYFHHGIKNPLKSPIFPSWDNNNKKDYCNLLFHNVDFSPCNSEFISHNSDFFSSELHIFILWFIYMYRINHNCKILIHNFKKKSHIFILQLWVNISLFWVHISQFRHLFSELQVCISQFWDYIKRV